MEKRQDGRGRVVAALLLVGAILALCAVPLLVLQGFAVRVNFMGDTTSPEDIAESHHLLLEALITALAASLTGIAVGCWLRSKATVVVMSIVLCGTVLLFLAATVKPSAPAPSPVHCQEYSGGGNECPGD